MSKWITVHDAETDGRYVFNVNKINAIYDYGENSMIVTENGSSFLVLETVGRIMELVAEA